MLDTTEDRRCNNQQLKKELTLFSCWLAALLPLLLAGRVAEEVVLLCDGFGGSRGSDEGFGDASRFGTITASFGGGGGWIWPHLDAVSSPRASVVLLVFLGVLRRWWGDSWWVWSLARSSKWKESLRPNKTSFLDGGGWIRRRNATGTSRRASAVLLALSDGPWGWWGGVLAIVHFFNWSIELEGPIHHVFRHFFDYCKKSRAT